MPHTFTLFADMADGISKDVAKALTKAKIPFTKEESGTGDYAFVISDHATVAKAELVLREVLADHVRFLPEKAA